MAEAVVIPGREIAGSERAVLSPQVPGATVAAERIVVGALEICAQRMGLESPEAAARHIEQGDGLACMHCCRAMSRQIAESLGSTHQGVQAVYAPDCDSCPQGFCFGEEGQVPPSVHLLVWARRKTAALDSRVTALRGSLARVYQDRIGTRGLSSLLNVRVLEDADLRNWFGSGRRNRWSIRLQAYLLAMSEPVDVVYSRPMSH